MRDSMYSIGKLCSEFNLSRSTLLYYSKIGLLTASVRTQSNYRQYSEDDKSRLRKICDFREAGVPLNQIIDMHNTDSINENDVLESRLSELSHEIRYLRMKQKLIVEMLKTKNKMILIKCSPIAIKHDFPFIIHIIPDYNIVSFIIRGFPFCFHSHLYR